MEPLNEKHTVFSKRNAIFFDGILDPAREYADSFYETQMLAFQEKTRHRIGYRFLKRFFDLLVAVIFLVILSPLMLAVAIAIKCDSEGPVIFKQNRVGLHGKVFRCYKFRSMKTDAPAECPTSCFACSEKYLTRVGRVLRRLSLDELPQLWCLLVGTMSLIGYRPLVLTEKKCNEMRRRLNVFSMRPGISGYAQVRGRDDVYYKNKAIMDAYYVRHAGVWLDLKLLLQTVAVVFKKEGNKDAKRTAN